MSTVNMLNEDDNSKALYIFLDESGNFDFGTSGTNYYVLTAVAMLNPLVSSQKLQSLKYVHLENGTDIEGFHASEDKQVVRDSVFCCLNTLNDNIDVYYVYKNKKDVLTKDQAPAEFYGCMGTSLIVHVLNNC